MLQFHLQLIQNGSILLPETETVDEYSPFTLLSELKLCFRLKKNEIDLKSSKESKNFGFFSFATPLNITSRIENMEKEHFL